MKKLLIAIPTLLVALMLVGAAPVGATEKSDTYVAINNIRRDAGENALKVDKQLEECAVIRAKEASKRWSHTRPDGRAFNTVNAKIVYGENLVFVSDITEDIVDLWMESPAHADNILYPDFKTTGIGYYTADDGTIYTCQLFGY